MSEPVEPIVVPPEALSPEALQGLIEAFIAHARQGFAAGEGDVSEY